MSGYRKGTRKPKSGFELKDIEIGGLRIPPALAVSVLLAALYCIFLLGSRLEAGSDAVVLAAFSTLSFAAFAYLAKSGVLAGLRPFIRLIDVFLALSAVTLIWAMAVFLNIANVNGLSGVMISLYTAVAYAFISFILIGIVVYYEKDKLEDIHVKAGSMAVMAMGVAAIVLCALLGAAILYFTSGSLDKIANLAGIVLIFSLVSAAYEELWFRGLLLSRLLPLAGEKSAIAIQAIVFGVFEAAIVYMISPQLAYLPVVFVIGSILGYLWGRMTLQDDSIVGAFLFHASFYLLIGLPLFAGILPA